MRETWVQPLGWEDPLEEGMATHSSILAWRIPTDRGAWQGPQSMGSQRVGHDWVTKHTHTQEPLALYLQSQEQGKARRPFASKSHWANWECKSGAQEREVWGEGSRKPSKSDPSLVLLFLPTSITSVLPPAPDRKIPKCQAKNPSGLCDWQSVYSP